MPLETFLLEAPGVEGNYYLTSLNERPMLIRTITDVTWPINVQLLYHWHNKRNERVSIVLENIYTVLRRTSFSLYAFYDWSG